jgi:hypothetical protein
MTSEDYNRHRILHETGYLAEQERRRKQRADDAARRWREAGKRLAWHKSKKVGGGGFPWR